MKEAHPKSFERVAFATMAALTLAPLLFHALWLWLASQFGLQGDALVLTLGSLAVAAGAAVTQAMLKRRVLAGSIGVAAGIGMVMAVLAGEDMAAKAGLAAAFVLLSVIVASLMAWLMPRLPEDIDGMARPNKIKAALLLLLAGFSIFQTAKLSTYMGDAQRTECSVMPSEMFLKTHSCLTAYVQALKLAQAGETNLYDVALWPDEKESAEARGTALAETGPYAPFYLDGYMYPPQFLLLPTAVLTVSDDFLVQRAIWFGLCGLVLAISFWIVALWVGVKGRRQAFWLIPLVWSSLVVMVTLQVGNVHHVVMAIAILAMVAFDRQKPALGGALLAFAVLAKVSPGIMVIVLLVQRRWRDLAWTAGFGLLFTLLTVLLYGIGPVESFLGYQLQRLLSGDSVRWFSSSDTNVMINSGPFSIPFKLSILGVHFSDAWGTAKTVNMAFTLALVGLTVWAALQKRNRYQSLCLWLGILTLSALQSPFSPGYVSMPAVWMMTVLAMEVKSIPATIAFVLVWVLVNITVPGTSTFAVWYSFVQLAAILGVILFAIWRRQGQEEFSEISPAI